MLKVPNLYSLLSAVPGTVTRLRASTVELGQVRPEDDE